jgi:hypothetical protein
MSTTEMNTAPANKTIKTITFRRNAVKRYYETYDLTYKDFAAKIREDGWDGKEVKDGSLIKKLWDELVENGQRCWNDTGVSIDVDAEIDHDAEDDEDWDEEEANDLVWEYIFNDVTYDDSFPECAEEGCDSTVINEGEKCEECSKTPEQKEAEAKKKEEEKEKHKAWLITQQQKTAEQTKKAEEYAKKQKEERIENAPEAIRYAILSAAELYKVEPTTEEDEQWKVKAMKNVARIRLLDQMKDLVVQLKMVAKW